MESEEIGSTGRLTSPDGAGTVVSPRYRPFALAALGAVLGLASAVRLSWPHAVTIAADAFFVIYLVLTLAHVPRLTKTYLRRHAASSDAPVLVIFLITLATVVASMLSLFAVINAAQGQSAFHYGLALLSVPLGWATIHVMAAIHYAHLFWQPPQGESQPRKGLDFPGTKEPDGWDFIYFSFVIGMTAQTSDVDITGQHMRRFNLIHAVVSFFFNAVLVAAAVNVAVTLGN